MSRLSDVAEQVLGMVEAGAEAEVKVIEGTEALTRSANSYIHQTVARRARVSL
jgi:hypothetical protein